MKHHNITRKPDLLSPKKGAHISRLLLPVPDVPKVSRRSVVPSFRRLGHPCRMVHSLQMSKSLDWH
jgi:hypothetical protein